MAKHATVSASNARGSFSIAGTRVEAGERRRCEIPVARLPTQTWLSLPLTVVHGARDGAVVWLSAAIHGDEVNGIEIIRRILDNLSAKTLAGTVIAVPIVNVFGFIEQGRYLPDRRDLNRSFPGSRRGSLGARLAHLFMTEIVNRATHGIDLHTASHNRVNLPQVRGNLDDAETLRCAHAFGAPVIVHAAERDGSLRQAAVRKGLPVLVYEAGEALRFDESAIAAGVTGVLNVLGCLGMLADGPTPPPAPPLVARTSRWVRASNSGLFQAQVGLGEYIAKGQMLGVIRDAFGDTELRVRSRDAGLVIARTENPLVHRGDALVHIALTDNDA